MMTDTSSAFTDYLLAEIRCAVLRGKLMVNDLATIGIALNAGFISADDALEHLHDCGALRLVAASSSVTPVSTKG